MDVDFKDKINSKKSARNFYIQKTNKNKVSFFDFDNETTGVSLICLGFIFIGLSALFVI